MAELDDNIQNELLESTAVDSASKALAESIPDTIFQKAIVVEVIFDLAAFVNQKNFSEKYNENTITNFNFLKRAPRNSLLVKIANAGQAKRSDQLTLCLPFFPPHLCFPTKVGEVVWVISPTPIGKSAKVQYWMCRVPSWNDTDDVNYTHFDRENHSNMGEPSADAADRANNDTPKSANKDDPNIFGFPNGTADPSGFTFGDEPNEFDKVVLESLSDKSFKFEPVPRITKRPGDLVLQGSNNASIVLGTTRGYIGGHIESADSNSTDDLRIKEKLFKSGSVIANSSANMIDPNIDFAPKDDDDAGKAARDAAVDALNEEHSKLFGAIDIVVGRGRKFRKEKAGIHPVDDTEKGTDYGPDGQAPTYPEIKKTVHHEEERKNYKSETLKNPQAYIDDVTSNQNRHPIEGDPDFRYDAGRIYMIADSAVDAGADVDFGIVDQTKHVGNKDQALPPKPGAATVIKSDHIRIIARRDPAAAGAAPDADPAGVNGSIRIIKEGPEKEPGEGTTEETAPNNERAIIAIEPDGTIYIDGPKVVIGNAHRNLEQLKPIADDHFAKNNHIYIGGDGDDAKYTVFLAEELADTLIAFATDISHLVGGTATPPAPNSQAFGSAGRASVQGGLQASTGNSGSPIMNPTLQGRLVANLRENLKKCFSQTIKIR